jgi:RNA polymerase sigma-70 factor (sigma-E family)
VRHEEQYREYVVARAPGLRRTAFLLCGDWHRAEDAVQAVLVSLYVRPPRSWEAVDSWVRTALVRKLVDESRRPWRRERSVDVLPDGALPSHDPAERLAMLDALRTLPPMQRAVVVLRFWDDLSVPDTAAALGISDGTVKSHTSRGLAALRLLLENSR